uniref:Uncharacterized protein n=1 Tax=Opuntia streptacantha TaxID=393608 RepID=A0A7C9AFG7_OPUST
MCGGLFYNFVYPLPSFPDHRPRHASRQQQTAPDYLSPAVAILRHFKNPLENPNQRILSGGDLKNLAAVKSEVSVNLMGRDDVDDSLRAGGGDGVLDVDPGGCFSL